MAPPAKKPSTPATNVGTNTNGSAITFSMKEGLQTPLGAHISARQRINWTDKIAAMSDSDDNDKEDDSDETSPTTKSISGLLQDENTDANIKTGIATGVTIAKQLAKSMRSSSTTSRGKLSHTEIQTQLKFDSKGLTTKITADDVTTFISGLTSIRLRREKKPSWAMATQMITSTAPAAGAAASATAISTPTSTSRQVEIDLLTALGAVDHDQMKTWAISIWGHADADTRMNDGISAFYARRCFAEFLFNSMDDALQRQIQQRIKPASLWNDGPLVWVTIINHFFPTPDALVSTLRERLEKLSLESDHKGDLLKYTTEFRELLMIVGSAADDSKITRSFFENILKYNKNTHIHSYFIAKMADHYVDGKKNTIDFYLDKVESLHTLSACSALPFTASSAVDDKHLEHVAAMAGLVQHHTKAIGKSLSLLTSQENEVRQLRESVKSFKAMFASSKKFSGSSTSNPQSSDTLRKPPFLYEKPSDVAATKEFNEATWYWCQKCNNGNGQWSTSHNTDGTNGKDAHQGFRPRGHNQNKEYKRSRPSEASQAPPPKKAKPDVPTSSNSGSLKSYNAEFKSKATSLQALMVLAAKKN
jgi:hypothetical protein